MNRKLFLLLSCLFLSLGFIHAQTQASGTVVDETGEAVVGATVVAKGTTVGTVTDFDGKFTISMPSGVNTLVFNLMGMKTIEATASSIMKVVMPSDSKSLDEVVVTGLGVKKSEKGIGYSVSKISAADLVKSGESNVIQGLAAKTSGLMVTSSSGTPGASTKIVLRGVATFNGDNQPLIVVDGVPIDNGVNFIASGDDPYNNKLGGVQTANRALDINPEDIESVTVLKGPAAAAIYGQDAGNGAIIYTTKRGGAKKGLGITYNSSFEISKISQMPEIQKKYGQSFHPVTGAPTADSWGEDLIAAGKTIYDNIGNFFQDGKTYTNNISITGGDDKTSFRASFGATNMGGIIPESSLDRYVTRLTADTKLTDWLTVGGTFSYTNTKSTLVQNGSNVSGIMLPLLRMPVEFDGRNSFDPVSQQQINYLSAYDNPFFSVKYNPYTDDTDRVLGNFNTDIKLNKVFSITWKTGIDAYNTTAKQIYAYSSLGNNLRGVGQKSQIKYAYRNLYTDLLLKMNNTFGNEKEFTLAGLVGANYNYKQLLHSYERGTNLTIPGFYGFNNFKNLYVSDDDTFSDSKAVLADATIDYKSLVFLSLTGRYEWSSTFGKNSNGFFYPKADVAYIFSHLLEENSILNFGKIRLAYANVGISPAAYRDRTYFFPPYIADGATNGFGFPYDGQPGFAKSNVLSGFKLKPERNIGKEIGLELKLFNAKIDFSGTYYNQNSKDLLIVQPMAPSSGYSNKFVNIGEIQNKGVELGLTGEIINVNDFKWMATINWSKNVNKVTKLAPGVTEISVATGFQTPQSFAMEGEPFGVLYGTKFERDEKGNLLINEDGYPIKQKEYGKIGNPNPDWLMNINNAFSYKGINLSFLIDIRKGGDIWNGTWSSLNYRGKSIETLDRDKMYIIPGFFKDDVPGLAGRPNNKELTAKEYFSDNYMGATGSEIDIQDGSWVRLRDVNLSYRYIFVKKKPNFPIQYVEVGTTLRNMILITDYKGVDPETSLTGSSQNLSGYDYFNNPGTKSIIFNLKLGF